MNILLILTITVLTILTDVNGAVLPSKERERDDIRTSLTRLRNTLSQFKERPERDLTCLECRTALGTIDAMAEAGASDEEIMAVAVEVCIDFNMYVDDVCQQMVDLSAHEVIYVIKSTGQSFETMCGWLIVGGHCESHTLPPWTITLPPNKPPPSHPVPDPSSETIKILHLSDLHMDHMYEQSTLVECDHPLCCRVATNTTPPVDGNELSGYWGSYGSCDIPKRTANDGLRKAATHNPDIIYLTGDLPPHDVWMQSHETILTSIEAIVNLCHSNFPGIPVYMAIGNHEAAPVNSFVVPSEYDNSGWDMSWLYEELADLWDRWIPAECRPTVRSGGYFVTKPYPGFRVISVNMNYGHNGNWWLLMDNEDPADQLNWLIDELYAAEQEGDKVHILGHVPPSGTEDSWSHAFNQIVTRFESTITGLFFGHTHTDEWEIHFDPDDDTRPVAMSYIAPSLTTFGQNNPSFRIYNVDGNYEGATYTVMETETYTANLSVANSDLSSPAYDLSYLGSEAFRLKAFTPEHWANMTWDMATDDELFHNLLRAKNTRYATPPELSTCTSDCRKHHLCGLYKADRTNSEPCHRIQNQVDNRT